MQSYLLGPDHTYDRLETDYSEQKYCDIIIEESKQSADFDCLCLVFIIMVAVMGPRQLIRSCLKISLKFQVLS